MAKNEKIGFVGVGRMGANMARHLKDKGYTVSAVYDINKNQAAALASELGCANSDTLADVTSKSDVVITVVSDDKATRAIFGGRGDNLLKNAAGKVFINCATITPEVHVEVEKLAKKAKAEALEGCMASSITQARSGTLYLMVGGKKSTYQKVKPILEELSENMLYIGAAGKAAQVKALVNMVMNINTAGLAEGLALADALGLDLKVVRQVFSQTGANSRVLETDGEDMVTADHECYFSAAHAAKDSGIAGALGKKQKIDMPLNAATKGQYDRMVKEGLGELDKSGVAALTFKGRLSAAKKAATEETKKAATTEKTATSKKTAKKAAKKKSATKKTPAKKAAAKKAPAKKAPAKKTTAKKAATKKAAGKKSARKSAKK